MRSLAGLTAALVAEGALAVLLLAKAGGLLGSTGPLAWIACAFVWAMFITLALLWADARRWERRRNG